MSLRFSLILSCLLGTLLLQASPSFASSRRHLDSANKQTLHILTGHIDNGVSSRHLLHRSISTWDKTYTTPSGVSLPVSVSNSYPQDATDDALVQSYINDLDKIPHGSELSALHVVIVTPAEITQTCGADALACYFDQGEEMDIAGENNDAFGPSVFEVMAHEYGHHIANNRDNPPFSAPDYGPKYWSSYMGICPADINSKVFPGDEDTHYDLNPGEGWAETVRYLTDTLNNITPDWNSSISDIFKPDQTALEAAKMDILSPWKAQGSSKSISLNARRSSIAWKLPTPLDGSFSAQITTTGSLRAQLKGNWNDGVALQGTTTLSGRRIVSATICGEESIRLSVKRLSGAGTANITISSP